MRVLIYCRTLKNYQYSGPTFQIELQYQVTSNISQVMVLVIIEAYSKSQKVGTSLTANPKPKKEGKSSINHPASMFQLFLSLLLGRKTLRYN